MKKRSSIALLVIGLWCGVASAQPLFFDDFDGDELLPHWSGPPPSHWEFNVSDSQLHVTELHFPSIPKLGGNDAIIGAR